MSLTNNTKEGLCDYLLRQPAIINELGNEQLTQEQIQFLTNGETFVLPKRNDRILYRICSQTQFPNFHSQVQSNMPFNLENDIILLNKLIEHNLPIGRPLALCEDNRILGQQFYVREQKQGRIFTQQTLRQLPGSERREVFQEIIRVLVKLHTIQQDQQTQFNFQEQLLSLENLYKRNETKIQGNIENLFYWLKLNITQLTYPQTLCLGQVSLNNFVFHSTDIKIIDIQQLDSIHIGSPLMELAAFLSQYDVPSVVGTTDSGIKNIYKLLDLPSKTQLINQYCIERNLDILSNLSHFSIFVLLSQAVEQQVLIKQEKNQRAQQVLEVLSNASWDLVLDLTENDPFQIKLRSETDSYLWSKYPVSDRCKSYYYRIRDFMKEEVYPLEKSQFDLLYGRQGEAHWQGLPGIEHLQQRAKSMGLWNLFISDPIYGKGLTNLEYAFLSELMGMSFFGHEIFNCYAPETGNIKLLIMAGTEQQKEKYLKPLLEGSCKTFFTMSEKNVASSDPTNFETTIMKQGDGYIINGSKWMVSGIQDSRCKFGIIMGKTKLDPKSPFTEQSMFLIDYPNPNIILKSPLKIIGFDEAPHGVCEVEFNNVFVPKENMLGKEGSAFAMAQGRLLGGRLHHSVRLLGLARRSIDVLLERGQQRIHKNKKQKEDTAFQEKVGRIETDFLICRTMILNAAMILDSLGGRHMSSLKAVSETKAFVPLKCQQIVDQCIQLFGAQGVTIDQILQICYIACRGIRLMDGPCELHLKQVARFCQGNHLFNELVQCDGYITAKL